nr:TraX family protein [uncultured Mogibacterium sp.]
MSPFDTPNGERGSKASFNKWFFYIFYPVHLVVLWLIR